MARRCTTRHTCTASHFNPHTRAGRGGFLEITNSPTWRFQPTPPRGHDCPPSIVHDNVWAFQPRARAERGVRAHAAAGLVHPRTRAGCDLVLGVPCQPHPVSTHAPTAIATPFTVPEHPTLQPTRPRGAHLDCRAARRDHLASTHTPVKGATASTRGRTSSSRSFNPRARAGRDSSARPDAGGRCCFDPRVRVRHDHRHRGEHDGRPVSTHTPVDGATHISANLWYVS